MIFESKAEEKFWMLVYSRVLVAPGVDVDDAAKYSDQAVEHFRKRAKAQYAS
jgi:hypothetical protein